MKPPLLQGNTASYGPEKELLEKARYYRTLIHSLHEDILVIDRNYRITDVNDMALKTMGKARQEVVGRLCYEVTVGTNPVMNMACCVPCSKYWIGANRSNTVTSMLGPGGQLHTWISRHHLLRIRKAMLPI